jgi:type IV secretory pathway TrbL component
MNCIRLLFLLSMVLGLLINIGCPAVVLVGGGAAAGGGSLAYIKGELKSTEEVSLNRAWKATQTAMNDLEFHITDKGKDACDAELSAGGAGGKKIKIALKKISGTRTEIRIRVGTFLDKSLS